MDTKSHLKIKKYYNDSNQLKKNLFKQSCKWILRISSSKAKNRGHTHSIAIAELLVYIDRVPLDNHLIKYSK